MTVVPRLFRTNVTTPRQPKDEKMTETDEEDVIRGTLLGDLLDNAVLTVELADEITPTAVAEILTALNTIHKELTGNQLNSMRIRIGIAEPRPVEL